MIGFPIISLNKFLKIFAITAEITWTFVTYFVVPIIIIEEKSVNAAIKESKEIIKNYWMQGKM